MAKKGNGGLPRHTRTGKTSGANPVNIKSGIKLPKDGGSKSVAKGIAGSRYSSTKPTSAGKLDVSYSPKDFRNTNSLSRTYIKTKPNK